MTEVSDEVIIEKQKIEQVDGERKWYVYCHTNKTNGKKYIGITSQVPEERWRYGAGYKNQVAFWRAIQKYGWDGFDHEVVLEGLTEEDAKEKEVELIALYKTNCSRYNHPAYGYNMTDGGEGTVGHVVTQTVRDKISEKMKGRFVGENHPMYGISPKERMDEETYNVWLKKIHTEETHKKISEANKGNKNCGCRGEAHYLYGKTMSKEHKAKVTAHLTGFTNPRALPVYCIELDWIFWGAKEVYEKLKINRGDVGSCCKFGKPKSAGKHPETEEPLHWKYVYDYTLQDNTIVKGAITLGYLTEERVNNYLSSLKEKGD